MKQPVKDFSGEIRIHDLSHDGRGVGRLPETEEASSGKTCFVSGALPGESVRWKRSRSKRSFDEGSLLEVIEASPDRIEPACRHYDICGGCELQHLKPEAQLSWKEQQLRKTVAKAGVEPKRWLPALTREVWNYRRRARLAVSYKSKGKVQVGFRSKGTHHVASISSCSVLDKRLNDLMPDLQQLAAALRNHGLTRIELSAADDELAVCCYVKKTFDLHLPDLGSLIEKAQIWIRLSGQEARVLSGDPVRLRTRLTDNTEMGLTPSQFVQINGSMNRAMISQALEISRPDKNTRVLDLFCGAGNFSLAFAEVCDHVRGIEGSEALCSQASVNATNAGYVNLDFQVMDLNKPEHFGDIRCTGTNMVILDPPRAGAASLVPFLNDLRAEKILYVSCHPATMVRDLQGLKSQYQNASMGVMDMFPHTSHVEAMALLVKN